VWRILKVLINTLAYVLEGQRIYTFKGTKTNDGNDDNDDFNQYGPQSVKSLGSDTASTMTPAF